MARAQSRRDSIVEAVVEVLEARSDRELFLVDPGRNRSEWRRRFHCAQCLVIEQIRP